ncbi:WD40-repeat-containing domain protein [Trichoderma sp. SZMC 28014]
MHRLKERFRRLKSKPQNPGSSNVSRAQDGNNKTGALALQQSNVTPAPRIADEAAASLPGRLWDRAYDELKDETEAALVEAYEKILSRHLESERDIADANLIAQGNPSTRRAQMNQLITSGLVKIKRETEIKDSLDKGVQVILSAKDIISSAIQTVPQAALAWAGVCVALELFGNSTSGTKANRDGIEYVIQRMKWYWELPDTILKDNADAYNHLSKMKGGLEAQLIGLYKLLLVYQMKSVCSYYKNRGLVFLRDIAKLDDWDGDIKAIEKAETLFYKDSDVHRKEKMNANLEQIVTYVKQKMTKEDLQCFKDLGITDPSYDKKRIESTKGGLLEQSYCWILENPDFLQWRDDEERRLLWIRGDPGKGKTMLLCGIANELRRISASSGPISYFFCQATDQRINNANAVLWGLMFMLVDQQPALMHHIRSKYDASGKGLFLGGNSWFALSEIFSDMLKDPALTHAYLLIDALDECVSNREPLLDLVVQNLSTSSRVKWILSSRNWPEIERQLAESEDLERISLSLEVNADLVSRAVDAYIEHEISQLGVIKYHPALKDQMQQQMQQKANGTFLWVALVVKDLRDGQDAEYEDPLYILNILKEMPSDLASLYSLMVERIDKLKGNTPNLCKRILSIAALASRPLSLTELRVLAGFGNDRINDQTMERLVNKCGSFLTIRDCTIYFIHQSAKDHLILDKPTQPIIFSSGHSEVHYTIFSHSLRAMTLVLKENIYALPHPDSHIDEVETPDPDPLAAVRYSCAYWIDHLCNGISNSRNPTYQNCFDDAGPVSVFLRTHFLHWLEALSLLQKISDNVSSWKKLESLLQTQYPQAQLIPFLNDGHRFILYFIRVIEAAPLQLYSSALIFSPMQSLVRQTFDKSFPTWIHNKPLVKETWSPCLQILEAHDFPVCSMAFSGDNKLATTSYDGVIKIWDIATGTCLRILSNEIIEAKSLCFLHNERLASGSRYGSIQVWDLAAGTCIQTLEDDHDSVAYISALADNKLASVCDRRVRIWDMATGVCVQTLEGHTDSVEAMNVLGDDKLASRSRDRTIKIWDVATGICVQTIEVGDGSASCMAALSDNRLALGLSNGTVQIRDLTTGVCVHTLEGHRSELKSMTVITDGKLATSELHDEMIKIWDIAIGECVQTLEGHRGMVTSMTALTDKKLASGSNDGTVRIWDTTAGTDFQALEGHSDGVYSMDLSRDGRQMASGSDDKTVKIWNTATGKCVQTLKGHDAAVRSVSLSEDGKLLASGSDDWTVKIWDTAAGVCVQTLGGQGGPVRSVALSRDGKLLAFPSYESSMKIWDRTTVKYVQTLPDHDFHVKSVAFSRDGKQVASGSDDETVKIWDAATGECVQTLPVGGVTQVSFDEEKTSRLQTKFGILSLDAGQVVNEPGSSLLFTGYGINKAGSWITRDGKPLLWLPLDYGQTALAIRGSTVAIGSHFGRVLMLRFSEQEKFSV